MKYKSKFSIGDIAFYKQAGYIASSFIVAALSFDGKTVSVYARRHDGVVINFAEGDLLSAEEYSELRQPALEDDIEY